MKLKFFSMVYIFVIHCIGKNPFFLNHFLIDFLVFKMSVIVDGLV